MTPSARLEAAIEILDGLAKTAQPADRFLRDFFRARRYAGSKDRAAIGERVFTISRHRASYAWRMRSESPRALAIASLLAEGADEDGVASLFAGQGYGPAPLTQEERAAIAQSPGEAIPIAVRGEFPGFLEGESHARLRRQARRRDGGDARARVHRSARQQVEDDARSFARGVARGRVRGAARAVRAGRPAPCRARQRVGAAQSPLFESGAFEFQDEAAQIASLLCGAKPGERILDLAAGAGGKSLALAAAMKNKGEIVACDIRAGALKELELRAARAGVSIIATRLLPETPPQGAFDAVLVDAPCSGSGTWRRQPELKWRLTPPRIAELMAQQDALLDDAVGFLKPGARLIYATCSVLPSENEDRVAQFLARHPGFAVAPADARWSGAAPPAWHVFSTLHRLKRQPTVSLPQS